jgi:hypothetical protein
MRALVVAPFLGARTRDLLADADVSYADATGNVRVVVSSPAIFLEGLGAEQDPERTPRNLHSLRGTAAARVVRALCEFQPPYGVRALAEASATPLGTVSRVVSFLETEALLTRDERKQIVAVDWTALLSRWSKDYGVASTNTMRSYLPSALATDATVRPRSAPPTRSTAGSSCIRCRRSARKLWRVHSIPRAPVSRPARTLRSRRDGSSASATLFAAYVCSPCCVIGSLFG